MTAPYKADQIAAERLLKAAVRQASRELAHAIWVDSLTGHVGEALRTHDRREAGAQMLAGATRAAGLLLKGRPE